MPAGADSGHVPNGVVGPRSVIVRVAALRLQDAESEREGAPRYLEALYEARSRFGSGADGLDRDVEYLGELLRGRSDEAVGEILKDYLGEDG
jgi:hypothetical protein